MSLFSRLTRFQKNKQIVHRDQTSPCIVLLLKFQSVTTVWSILHFLIPSDIDVKCSFCTQCIVCFYHVVVHTVTPVTTVWSVLHFSPRALLIPVVVQPWPECQYELRLLHCPTQKTKIFCFRFNKLERRGFQNGYIFYKSQNYIQDWAAESSYGIFLEHHDISDVNCQMK